MTTDKEALAQPEQEPVAVIGSDFQLLYCRNDWSKGLKVGDCLYTTPPQRKPLTDEQISTQVEAELTHYWNGEYIDTSGARDQLTAFARAIEAAHGIKY
jgi:hypothetical protein